MITPTADGSNTLYNDLIGETYHSKHGALQESKHVFIEAGLKYALRGLSEKSISILEIGFGTGLNFLMTSEYAAEESIGIDYTGIEAYPLSREDICSTLYNQYVSGEVWGNFLNNYELALKSQVSLCPGQLLSVVTVKLEDYESQHLFDLVYFDAFSVQHQPEMWSDEIIGKVCTLIKPGGTFVTYAITGKLKRALKSFGMCIEKLPGAPGKREMLRATKEIANLS